MARHVITENGEAATTVQVGRGLDELIVAAVHERPGGLPGNIAVLCQPSTYDLANRYASALSASGISTTGYSLPDGEESKQIAVVEEVYRYLNEHRFSRSDLIVGVGGGALTDAAGFIAGTYLRGIAAMYVPTTVLGAVDASIGGKTGVNVDGKNLAGVFSHPEAVFIDADTLDALPDAIKRDGAAEAIKAGFIRDMRIAETYESDGLEVDLETVVDWSVAVKADVVNADFRERGVRAILNYGHTVGHAVETSTGRSHGESVAIGMIAAGAASEHALGFGGAVRQAEILSGVGLPIHAADAHKEQVMALMALDKKRDGSELRMVLLADFARPEVRAVDDATVQAALVSVGIT
ncbi:MAG: 3-dehydroquinate synthase [Acidimicrobiia bacterium]